jgi:hypothetical protein
VFSQPAFVLQVLQYLYHPSRWTPIIERCFRPQDNSAEQVTTRVEDVNVARRMIPFPPDKKVTAAPNLAHSVLFAGSIALTSQDLARATCVDLLATSLQPQPVSRARRDLIDPKMPSVPDYRRLICANLRNLWTIPPSGEPCAIQSHFEKRIRD